MRAPVYRNASAQNTFLGLAFPTEVLLVLTVLWVAMLTVDINLAALITIGVYVLIRVTTHGRPEAFLQHWLNFQLRRALSRGSLSAAARARIPRFPRGPYLHRDLPRRAGAS